MEGVQEEEEKADSPITIQDELDPKGLSITKKKDKKSN